MSNSPVPQRIVCAANRHPSGEVILGIRHWDSFMHQSHSLHASPDISAHDGHLYEQGFVDQFGSFMSRTYAWKVAQAAGQIIRRVGGDTAGGGTLYSENLY